MVRVQILGFMMPSHRWEEPPLQDSFYPYVLMVATDHSPSEAVRGNLPVVKNPWVAVYRKWIIICI